VGLPQWTNNGLSELASAMNASQTTLSLLAGTGSRFPTADFPLRVWDDATFLNPIDDPDNEIVFCSSRSGDTCTVVRAQEGSTGVAHGSGDAVALVLTKKFRDDLVNDHLQIAGHLFGLRLSNNGTDAVNDIDIAIGEAASNDAAIVDKVMMRLASGLTKQIDATWAAGTNAGMRDSGAAPTFPAAATYHIFLIKRMDTGTVDVFASPQLTSPLPTNYTHRRRIGSIAWNGSSIRAFSQFGDEFLLDAAILDVDATSVGTSAVLRTLSVPSGIKVMAIFNAMTGDVSAHLLLVSSPDQSDQAPSSSAAPLASMSGVGGISSDPGAAMFRIRTNTTGQIRTRVSTTIDNLRIATLGWVDRRGRDDD
jgi:hypothetical protein